MINVTQTFLPPINEYILHLEQIWTSKWLTNRGCLVQELEKKLIEYLNVKNLLIVSNGTIALQIAIKTLDLKGEIITTPFSYVATTSSIAWEHCTPVFVDIDENFLTIDETEIEKAITKKTSAILATHVYGNPCNIEAIDEIAKRHQLKVIYDAAHCFGIRYRGESILKYGDISTLSFHATKLFHTGEGGGICCNNEEFVQKVFYKHNFGHNGDEAFFGLGINGKISELNAAMGLSVFPYVDEIIKNRREVSLWYDTLLSTVNIRKPVLREEIEYNYAYYPIIFSTEHDLLKVKQYLNTEGIFPRRYFYPSLNTLPYLERKELPISESISRKILCLPLYPDLAKNEVEKISALIKGVIE